MTAPEALDALRSRYRSERDKRIRPDGNQQYVKPVGALAGFLDDPFSRPAERDPITDHTTVTCVGGGFAGLITAAALKEAGVDDVRIVDKAGDVGGTWYWNRYPGAQCDTASMVYMPLLEETGHMPSEKYAHGPELFEHCQRIAKQYGLYENALFNTQVRDLEWDATRAVWTVRTNRGDRFTSQFVTLGVGPLHALKLPGVPGIADFAGIAACFEEFCFLCQMYSRHRESMMKRKNKNIPVIAVMVALNAIVCPSGEMVSWTWIVMRAASLG